MTAANIGQVHDAWVISGQFAIGRNCEAPIHTDDCQYLLSVQTNLSLQVQLVDPVPVAMQLRRFRRIFSSDPDSVPNISMDDHSQSFESM